MKTIPHVTLEQWRVFHAIVKQGGYAQAALHLHRSQSAISYSMSRLQQQLGIALLKIEGRKALLTEQGHILLQRSGTLVKDAADIENFAHHLSQGREAEIKLVVDAVFPNDVLMTALAQFSKNSQGTRIQLQEVILSGATDALINNEADIVIGVEPPDHLLSDALIEIELIAVARPEHPLFRLKHKITATDLAQHTHVVIQDSGHHEKMDVGWLNSSDRWTVSSIDSALSAIEHGLGYGWIPTNRLIDAFRQETIKPLSLEQGTKYKAVLFMSFGRPLHTGPATRELTEILKRAVEKMDC